MATETKTCTFCGQEKSLDEYYVKDKATGRRFAYCRTCAYERYTKPASDRRRDARQAAAKAKPTERACTRCGTVLPVEDFPIKSSKTGQRRSMCLPCHNAQSAEWKAAHAERKRSSDADYRERNAAEIREAQRLWREEHPERYSEIHSKWKKRNVDAMRNMAHRRRARQQGNGGSWTREEWEALKLEFDHTCLWCGRKEPEIKLTMDHVVPIEAGGENSIENIQPLCRSCNSRKHTQTLDLRILWRMQRKE